MKQVDCARCFEPMQTLHVPDICPECRDCLRYHCDGMWLACSKCEEGGYHPKPPGMCACDDCWFVARPRARLLMTRIMATVPVCDGSPEEVGGHDLNDDWSCRICDGGLSSPPAACGCCGTAQCSVYCGCRCPSEFFCAKCNAYHVSPCLSVDDDEAAW